jgi:hypothetical protein
LRHTRLVLLATLLGALLSGWCGNTEPKPKDGPPPLPTSAKPAAPARLQVLTEKEVTFYPTYGYKDAKGWNIDLRGWVHEDRPQLHRLLEILSNCSEAEMGNFRSRSADLLDDDKTFEKVIIKFDSDPDDKPYELSRSLSDGIVKLNLVLTDEKATQLLGTQASSNGWLTYRAVSSEHTGLGRVRLIEPDPNGVSLVSDIDDTIKITEIPAGTDIVLRNTFCLDFKSVREPDMAMKYKALGDIPIHYVSGGPEQLFGPLYDYLITGEGGFPEGTFHLKFFPKTLFSRETTRNLRDFIMSSLEVTYQHKLKEITTLMERFPDRKFILVGDSGEVDPEVYNEVRKRRPEQVKEIWIRDVINDELVNQFRLEGMTVIPVNPPICIESKHFAHLAAKMKEIYPTKTYQRNMAPPCGQ